MGSNAWAAAAAVAALLLAGCSADDAEQRPLGTTAGSTEAASTADATDTATAVAEAPLDAGPRVLARASGCTEAGGYSTYSTSQVGEPWTAADAGERLGRPTLLSIGPNTGTVGGNFHPATVCTSWSTDADEGSGVVLGWGGAQVEPPPFDPGGADLHYVTEHVFSPVPAIREFLQGAGVDAPEGTGTVEWTGDRVLYSSNEDAAGMAFDARGPIQPLADKPDEIIRLWAFARVEGGWRVVALDVVDTGGGIWSSPGGATSVCSGTRPGGGAVAAQPCQNFAYVGVAREIRAGPAPDLVLPGAYRR